MVGRPVPGCCGGKITHHAMRAPADSGADAIQHLGLGHIADKDLNAVENICFQKINPDKFCAAAAKLAAVRRDLQPATWRTAQIDDRHAGLQQLVAVIHLFQLQRRARPETAGFRLGDKRVVQLARQPALRRRLAATHLPRLTREAGIAAVAPPGRAARRGLAAT